jgi:hypothetical protein
VRILCAKVSFLSARAQVLLCDYWLSGLVPYLLVAQLNRCKQREMGARCDISSEHPCRSCRFQQFAYYTVCRLPVSVQWAQYFDRWSKTARVCVCVCVCVCTGTGTSYTCVCMQAQRSFKLTHRLVHIRLYIRLRCMSNFPAGYLLRCLVLKWLLFLI